MNNKSLPIIILAVVVVSVAVKVFFFSASKVAYIDTAKLMESSIEMQQLRAKLKAESDKVKANVDTLTMDFQKALQQHEKGLSKMTPKEKQLSEELLRTKQNQVMQYRQAVEQKVMQDEQAQSQIILKNINAKITEYGKSKGYKIIFATANGNIAYADESVNITEDIIKELNGK
jgi:outer membrane protein